MNRRKFLFQTSIVSLGFVSLSRCVKLSDNAAKNALSLVKDPSGYLDLPEGFSYKIISKSGTKMSDGLIVPGRPDGMGCFHDSS